MPSTVPGIVPAPAKAARRRWWVFGGVGLVVIALIATIAIDKSVAANPERPLPEILGRLRRANPDDDTCILAARPATGETQDLSRYLRSR